jgi:protein gp37
MLIEGMENDFVSEIWQVVEATPRTGREILVS